VTYEPSTDAMRRFAALLAAELQLAKRSGVPPTSPRDLAPDLRQAYALFKDRFGASEEAAAVFRAEVTTVLAGDHEGLVAAALAEIGSNRRPVAPGGDVLEWRRLRIELVVGCVVVGLGLLIRFPTALATLSCTRPPASPATCATCRLQWHVLFGWVPIRDTAVECLDKVEHVRQEASWDTVNNEYYRVMLSARGEAAAYTMNPSGDRAPTLAAATQIQAFLADPSQPALRVVLSPTGGEKWLGWVGDALLILGLITVVSVPLQIGRSWIAPGPHG